MAGGYGRNYLIPRGFAMPWTRGAEKQIELIKRARSAREIRGVEDAKAVAGQLEGLQRALRPACGRQRPAVRLGRARRHRRGRARGRGGPELDRRRIEVRDPIKTVGAHQVRGPAAP